jgi:uncharacterized radical SAM superfamily Fe-S cluster-containing enzyme
MDQDSCFPNECLNGPINDDPYRAILAELQEMIQMDIHTRSQIANDSINNILHDNTLLDVDKQNEESIPLENVTEGEESREMLVENRSEEEQRAFQQAENVSDVAHRKLSPQKSLAQEKANGKSIIIMYIGRVLRYVAYMLGVYTYTYIHIYMYIYVHTYIYITRTKYIHKRDNLLLISYLY